MAETIILSAQMRDQNMKARALRREDILPGVLYGNGFQSQSLQFVGRTMRRVISEAGTSTLITLDIDGQASELALIREIQRNPVTGSVTHVDLYRVVRGVAIRNAVPIVLVGVAPAVEQGAVVTQFLESLEIECMPENMPAVIEVDISVLTDAGSHIVVSELVIPQGVEVLSDPEADVVQASFVTMAAAEEEEVVEEEYGVEGEELETDETEAPADEDA